MGTRYSLPVTTVPPVDLSPYAPRSGPAFTGTALFGGPVRLSDGTAASPGLSFAQDTDSGLTRIADNTLGLAAAGTEQFRVAAATASVNIIQATGATVGNSPIFSAIGADTNIGINFNAKNGGGFAFNATGTQFAILPTAGSVNYAIVTGAAAGSPPSVQVRGEDASVDLALVPKGSGGRVRFGNLTATDDAPVTGFIEVRDSSGVLRKLAVIA